MFDTDARLIADKAITDHNTVIGAGLVTLLSIRQPFFLVPAMFRDVQDKGYNSPFLFGWKREGFRQLNLRGRELQDTVCAAREGSISHEETVFRFLSIPGMGIVKASFMAQMLTLEGACLDTHNLRHLGLDQNTFRLAKTLKADTVRDRIVTYVATWRAHGDSATWWNDWCEFVASKYPARFANAAHVSDVHTIATHWDSQPA